MVKNKAGSLDTNVLLRFALKDFPEHTEAAEGLLLTGGKFEIADAALFEMVFVLEKVYHLSREQITRNVFGITRNSQFNCNRTLFEMTMPLYVQESKLSIVDCAVTQYAKLNNSLPLFTFDVALTKACPDSTQKLI